MIISMTGYGKGAFDGDSVRIEVESKSINHRYLNIRIRMSKELSFMENRVRKILQQKFSRGHFDISINLISTGEKAKKVGFDGELAHQFIETLQEINRRFALDDKIRLSSLIQFPELFTIEKPAYEEESLENLVEGALSISLNTLNEMRREEGKLICQDIKTRLADIETVLIEIERRFPQVIQEYRQNLQEKVSKLMVGLTVDEDRLLQEVILHAERGDITEEMVRLKFHIKQFRMFLDGRDSVGKKLDFLVQEMNRETNTTGNKAPDIEITSNIVAIKSELEKIREQIQNVE